MNLACEGSRQAKRGGREQRPPRSSPSLLQARGLYTAEIPRRFPAGVPRARGLFLRGVGSFPLRRRPFLLEGPSDLLDAVLGKTPCVPSFAYILLYMASSLAWVWSSSHSLHSVELRGRPCICSSAAVLGNRQEGHSADDRHEGDLHPPIIPGHIAGALDAVSY